MSLYACACLNVRIRVHEPPPSAPPAPALADPHHVSIYAGDDGISVVHPQLTLRSRTVSEPDHSNASESLLRRRTSLTCLICRTSVYRVLQLIPPDLDASEGPVLPTEEWVEQQVLRSASGWIELSTRHDPPSLRLPPTALLHGAHASARSKTDDSVARAEASEAYSPIFRVLLPACAASPAPIPDYAASQLPSSEPRQPDAPLTVLPPLSPLFPPPPFVPSHPIFGHLSAVAVRQSDALRQKAEEDLAQIVQARVSEIGKQEDELRRQVQLLWVAFREAEAALAQERKVRTPDKQQTAGASSSTAAPAPRAGTDSRRLSPVAISDFVPVSTSRPPSSAAREAAPSALSTSLATSSFHHPRAAAEDRRSASPVAASLASPATLSSTLVESVLHRDSIRRDMREQKDVATSFRYTVDMEAERNARARQSQSLSNIRSPPPRASVKLPAGDDKPSTSKAVAERSEPVPAPSTPKRQAPLDDLPSPSRSKGKRKVTFDIKPAALESDKKSVGAAEQGGEASIFDLEDDDSNVPRQEGLTLPLREPVESPARPPRQPRTSSGSALPQSLQTLRPASLPATVALRASDTPRPQSPPQATAAPPAPAEAVVANGDEALSPHDQELARLVNAATPSHRSAWKKDSRSWKLFANTRGAGESSSGSLDGGEVDPASPHEDERNGNYALSNAGIAASLPISIAHVPRNRGVGAPPPDPDTKPEQDGQTSASYRRASYAARDRTRSLDPGALDFETAGEDDDEGADGEDAGEGGSLSRGKRHALRILQARSELPAEGMWRSLAT
ncbi:hypothetical protein BC834DRAFT_968437 [Gloeopeniophorella convolvens]|nr:hypothetical protein BC834DRAFT_968437 [Gloeopeniophorella convolvens]